MMAILFGVFLPVAVVAGLIVGVARRGLQMRQLVSDGVETTGQVVARLDSIRRRRGRRVGARRIHYSYTDAGGTTHENRSIVTDSFWNEQVEGGPIAIVYSKGQPQISAPSRLVEQSRKALAH